MIHWLFLWAPACAFFPFFPKDFRGSPGRKNPCFFRSFSLPFAEKARKGRSGKESNFPRPSALPRNSPDCMCLAPSYVLLNQNSADRGQSRKIRFSKFPGSELIKFSELCVLLFFLGKTDRMLPKSRFSKPLFGHSAGSPKLDRPHCKRFWY